MLKTLWIGLFIVLINQSSAQKITIIDSSDLVIIDGEEKFYLQKLKSDYPFFSDFELQNLNKKTLARIEYKRRPITLQSGEIQYENYYIISFPETGDLCEDQFTGSLNIQRTIAKLFIKNKLIENNTLNHGNVRTYVIKNHGYVSPINPQATSSSTTDDHLSLVGTEVHNESGLLLITKKEELPDQEAYSLYDKFGEKIAFVTRKISTNEDWKISLNENVITLLYNPSQEPLLYITRYLISKKYL